MARQLPALAKVNMEKVLKEFKSHYVTAVSTAEKVEQRRQERLRVSGFPYCGLRHAYERMTFQEQEQEADFGSYYYTQVGTVAHEIIQNFLGRGGRMYGAWRCLNRKCKGKRDISRKNICPKCGGLMRYEELTVKAFKNVSGHLDGVYRSEAGEYFLVDYKTTSVRVIQTQKYNRTLPYHHNVCQIKAYCALIELMFDIEISGWILMYVSRDSPMQFVKAEGKYISAKEKKKILKKIKGYDNHWERVMNLTSFAELQGIIAEKPCGDYDEYKREFDTFEPCPLATSGVCFKPKQLNELMEIVWDERPPNTRLG